MTQNFFYKSADEAAQKLSTSIAQSLQQAVAAKDSALLVLPGGSSPRELMTMLGREKLPWGKITITTTDERRVPIENPDSNAGQIRRLMGQEPVWLGGEGAFEAVQWPADVTVLGMGEDGHIASIFPGAAVLKGHALIEITATKPPSERDTLTMETICDTARLILLVPGAAKRAVCQKAMNGETPDLPLACLMDKAKEMLELHIWDV